MNSLFKQGFKSGFISSLQLLFLIWVFCTIPENMYGPFVAVTLMCAVMKIWAYKITEDEIDN